MTNSLSTRMKYSDLSRLGLMELPFRISADPRFLYLTPTIASLIDRLLDLMAYEEGLGVVEGEIGIGKTSVARRLYDIAAGDDNNLHPVYIHTALYNSAPAAARDIADHFGLDTHRVYTTQLRILEEGILKIREDGDNPVLIIDDAQFMETPSLETIQNMINFDVSSKAVQIVLFGQPEIHRNFSKPSAESVLKRVVTWQKLSAFSFEDTSAMLNWRVQQAGRKEPLFTGNALSMIWDTSQGNPRDTINIANEALRQLIKNGGQTINGEITQSAIANFSTRPLPGI